MLRGRRQLLMGLLRLRDWDDLILVAMHHHRRARNRRQLPHGIEGLLQCLEHLRVREDHRANHLHRRQLLKRHEAGVDDQPVELPRALRRQVHGASRPNGPAVGDALRPAATGGGQNSLAGGEALVRVPTQLRQAGAAGAPTVASVIDGEQGRAMAVEHVRDVIHRRASLRISVEEIDDNLDLCPRRGQVEAVAHGVAPRDFEGAIANGPAGCAEVLGL
mmetsp:Transcript_79281/g.229296  ORF Transcript_79281/g.229296 Transcript_79281/m.229296 type:complete len:219 (-) Transcript_79281:224-880(-)